MKIGDHELNIEALIHAFFSNVKKLDFNFYFYNEAPLKFELGMFLQMSLYLGYKVQVERDISLFGLNGNRKKADIVIFTPAYPLSNGCYNECYALEVKLPRKVNGGIPKQMFKVIEDIQRMEEFKSTLLRCGKCRTVRTYVLTLTDEPSFYQKNNNSNNNQATQIASHFQNGISGTIYHPYNKKTSVTIKNHYSVTWRPANVSGDWQYYCFECM